MEKPLLPLALVSLAVGLVLISVAIGSQKTGKRAQKDPFACLLDAHGRCRHVDHREPTRMTLHAAARLPAIGRGQSTGPLCHSRNRTTGRFQAPETLGTMTTIIMRTTEGDMRMMLLLWDATLGNRSLKIVEIPVKTAPRALNNPDFPEK